jgi:hypothetical protein
MVMPAELRPENRNLLNTLTVVVVVVGGGRYEYTEPWMSCTFITHDVAHTYYHTHCAYTVNEL